MHPSERQHTIITFQYFIRRRHSEREKLKSFDGVRKKLNIHVFEGDVVVIAESRETICN